jgi:hypothetical protein
MVKCKCGGNSYPTKAGLKCRVCKQIITLTDAAVKVKDTAKEGKALDAGSIRATFEAKDWTADRIRNAARYLVHCYDYKKK